MQGTVSRFVALENVNILNINRPGKLLERISSFALFKIVRLKEAR
jgi:hypothetical protein